MTENASDHSEAVQEYIDATPESTFEFDRLSLDEYGSPYDERQRKIDDSE